MCASGRSGLGLLALAAAVLTLQGPGVYSAGTAGLTSIERRMPSARALVNDRPTSLMQLVRMEPDTNRPGQDYRTFQMKEARPEQCQAACAKEEKCLAFTYVKPGIQGRYARCYLKKGVPARVADRCCISGVKRTR
jgi:hypothetical protein